MTQKYCDHCGAQVSYSELVHREFTREINDVDLFHRPLTVTVSLKVGVSGADRHICRSCIAGWVADALGLQLEADGGTAA